MRLSKSTPCFPCCWDEIRLVTKQLSIDEPTSLTTADSGTAPISLEAIKRDTTHWSVNIVTFIGKTLSYNSVIVVVCHVKSFLSIVFCCDCSLELHRSMTLNQMDSSSTVCSMPSLPAAPAPAAPSSSTTVAPPPMTYQPSAPSPVAAAAAVNHHHMPPGGVSARPAVVVTAGQLPLNATQIPLSAAMGLSPVTVASHHQIGQSPYGGAVHYGSPLTYAIQVVRPAVVPFFNYGGGYVDAQSSLATKIKGGMTLTASASVGRNGNKYSPYWIRIPDSQYG